MEQRKLLVTTKEASERTGLSESELRKGWKSGRYPAIKIGRQTDRCRLRWNILALESAIAQQMDEGMKARAEAVLQASYP